MEILIPHHNDTPQASSKAFFCNQALTWSMWGISVKGLELRGAMPCDCEDWSCADFGEKDQRRLWLWDVL